MPEVVVPGIPHHVTQRGNRRLDTFLGLMKTCAKQNISFGDYLGDRLKAPDALQIPYLPDPVKQHTAAV